MSERQSIPGFKRSTWALIEVYYDGAWRPMPRQNPWKRTSYAIGMAKTIRAITPAFFPLRVVYRGQVVWSEQG